MSAQAYVSGAMQMAAKRMKGALKRNFEKDVKAQQEEKRACIHVAKPERANLLPMPMLFGAAERDGLSRKAYHTFGGKTERRYWASCL